MHEVCSSGKLTLSQTAMSFFHAHRVANSNNPADYARGSWRVDGTNANSGFGNTARIIIRCPHDHTEQSPRGRMITRVLAGHDEGRPWNGNWPHMDWPGIKLIQGLHQRPLVGRVFEHGGIQPAAAVQPKRCRQHALRNSCWDASTTTIPAG
jgi:hypothetical protein